MKDANILIAEDRDNIRELVSYFLSNAGHTIVKEAATLPDALAAIDAVAAGDIECDVVILDGDLKSRPVAGSEDARDITDRIREHNLGVKVIGFSGRQPLSEEGIPVDVDFDKNASLSDLPTLIENL